MDYNVRTVRAAGLEARWTRTRTGAPIIVARDASASQSWYGVTDRMWKDARRLGLRAAFESHTALGDFFSIPL